MTADEVLEEFLLDPCCMDCPASDCINERRMADEIVRLRAVLAALREPSEAVLKAAFVAVVDFNGDLRDGITAAVAAAEREASA